jgi:hypothetical protein
MLVPGGAGEARQADAPASGGSLRIHDPHGDLLSPTILRINGEEMVAYELKFLVAAPAAQQIQQWAADHMQPDANSDPRQAGAYQTTTLYLDTQGRDVLHRSAGYQFRKYRLRRYGNESSVYLERKTRRGDRVKKRRTQVPLAELAALAENHAADDWPGHWFRQRIAGELLMPACRVTYDRTAFVLASAEGPLRLTLDRRIRGQATDVWDLTPLDGVPSILPDQVVCEFKFRGALPGLFKQAIGAFQLDAGGVSKYRRIMLANGPAGHEGPGHA